ncbi:MULTISPECIES: ABC transporter permease [unclassified Paraburkholderia]|uniref:ABC transporter permease n=1 Tax=unclassified Paraburkholderia TaxID=2615204 RepID=UPI002AB239E0|nr:MULTISPECIES: FtsX-like permease family protein [unclassified Paraburkholderia]
MRPLQLVAFAARNLQRNRRRTLVALLTIAVGFSALALFAGYTQNVYLGTRNQAIHGEMLGHLIVTRAGAGSVVLDPEKQLWKPDESRKIDEVVGHAIPDAVVVPRLALSGLVSNGTISTIFVAEGVDPQLMRALRGPMAHASGALDPAQPRGISLSRGLAKLLDVKAGDDVSLLASTVRGQANALDAQVIDVFDTGNAATNDKVLFMPIELARELMDAAGRADRLTIVLPHDGDAVRTRDSIAQMLRQQGIDATVRTWEEAAATYRQVKAMFDVIFAFMFGIVLVICMMALFNVIAMNVIERTREIGSLRAIGMTRGSVNALFTIEAMLVVAAGGALGVLLTAAARLALNSSGIAYTPPNATDAVPLTVGLALPSFAIIFASMFAGAACAAGWAAYRRSRMPIVEALIHV